tara:strand:- start:2649 stop:3005 length:357 start_codon:yes stop_codon:yes gene_type:complete
MALIDCPECGKEISDKAPSCPNCGVVIAKDNALKPPEDFKESKTEKLSAIVYGFWKFILCILFSGVIAIIPAFLLVLGYNFLFNPYDERFPAFAIGGGIGMFIGCYVAISIMYPEPKD